MAAHGTGGRPGRVRGQAGARSAHTRAARLLEPWFAPFALVNGAGVSLTPILLPLVAARYGLGHVGLVMGAFNLGAFAAPLVGSLADHYHTYRLLAAGSAATAALSLWLFPVASAAPQVLLALGDGAGFAGAMTIANLLIVERRPKTEWNRRLGWLETALSVGQGGALILAAWLSGLSARDGLLIGAIVPAAAIPLALLLIARMPSAAVTAGGVAAPCATPGQPATARSETTTVVPSPPRCYAAAPPRHRQGQPRRNGRDGRETHLSADRRMDGCHQHQSRPTSTTITATPCASYSSTP